ncbi:Protein rrf1, partial [Dinochytrium kinnereticum]
MDQKRYIPPALIRPTKVHEIREIDINILCKKSSVFPRDYQLEMLAYAVMMDAIVVMPTGSGKTLIAAMFLKHFCMKNPKRIGMFIVDKIPLVYQQAQQLRDYTAPVGLTVYELCGDNIEERFITYAFPPDGPTHDESHIVVITAGCYRNLLSRNLTRVNEACAIVFDEVHHTAGNHTYKEILSRYVSLEYSRPALLGLTASPGNGKSIESTTTILNELSSNLLGAEIIMPSETINQNNSMVDHTVDNVRFDITTIEKRFESLLSIHFYDVEDYLSSLLPQSPLLTKVTPLSKSVGKLPNIGQLSSIKAIRDQFICVDADNTSDIQNFEKITAISHHLTHLSEYVKHLQIVGAASSVKPLLTYLANQRRLGCLKDDTIWLSKLEKAERLFSNFNLDCERELSGKTSRLISYLTESIDFSSSIDSVRGLVFVAERKTAFLLADILNSHEKIKALRPLAIVGQGGFEGMSWADSQKPIIQNFRSGVSKLLIATNVLEEGIDVPACNLVVHYDPPATATSYLQSRGRIRSTSGKFAIIGTEKELIRVEQVRKQLEFIKTAVSSRRNLPFTHSDFLDILEFWKRSAKTVGSLHKTVPRCDKPEFENDSSSSFCSIKVFSHVNLTYSFMCDLFEPCGSVVDDVFFSEFSAVCRLRLFLKGEESTKEWYMNFLRRISKMPKHHGVWTKLIAAPSVKAEPGETCELPNILAVERGCFEDLHKFFISPSSRKPVKCNIGNGSIVIYFDRDSWVIPFSSLDSKAIFSEETGF